MYCVTRIMSIRVRPVHIEWFPFSFVFSHVSLATTLQLTSVSRNDKWKHWRTLLGLHVSWLKLCKKKKKLYKKAKKSGLQNDWKVYPVMNNFLKKACKSARREHINKISEDLKSSGNPKPFWSFVSSVRKGSNELTALKVDDVTLTDDLDIAGSMNSYFSTVFTSEDYGNFPEYSNLVDSKLSTILCTTNKVSRLLRNFFWEVPGAWPPTADWNRSDLLFTSEQVFFRWRSTVSLEDR